MSFHHHEVVGREDDPQADAGAEVLQADGRRRVAAGVPASALPRATATASGPTRRCGAMSPTPARCCRGCTSWCAPTAPPATSGARRGCRPTTTTWRRGSPSWPRRRTCSGCGPTWTATRSWRFSASRPGPQVGEAWRYLKELRLDRGPLSHDEAVAELLKWWNARELSRRPIGVDYCLCDGDGSATMWSAPPDTDLDGDGALDAVGLDVDGDGTRRRRAGRPRRRRRRRSRRARRRRTTSPTTGRAPGR